jgi:hypothetical protein
VEEAIQQYLRLDRRRREIVPSGDEHAPFSNRTPTTARLISTRLVQKIVKLWAD